MNPIHSLSMKAAAAATRLTELELKKERPGGDGSRVISVALRELQSALEELRVAIEHLDKMSDTIAEARVVSQDAVARYDELIDAMPLPCVFTNDAGVVQTANDAAARLFNISARHLAGKPLLLFVADRDEFLTLLRETTVEPEPVSAELTIRPRDRKPRAVSLLVRNLPRHGQRCWFLEPKQQEDAGG